MGAKGNGVGGGEGARGRGGERARAAVLVGSDTAFSASAENNNPSHPERSGESWAKSKDLTHPAGFRAEPSEAEVFMVQSESRFAASYFQISLHPLFRQILPSRIFRFDQRNFLRASPTLQLLFPCDCGVHLVEVLHMEEVSTVVALSK